MARTDPERVTLARDGGVTVSLPLEVAQAIAEEREVSDLACNAFRVALGMVHPVPPPFVTRTFIDAERVAEELDARAENAVAAGERCREAFPEKARRYEDRGIVLREAAQLLRTRGTSGSTRAEEERDG